MGYIDNVCVFHEENSIEKVIFYPFVGDRSLELGYPTSGFSRCRFSQWWQSLRSQL
jgi:hypothetical protein